VKVIETVNEPTPGTNLMLTIDANTQAMATKALTWGMDVANVSQGVTINGLVILSDVPLPTNPMHTHPPGGLTAYYENNVIGGPGAFVIEAENFEAFGQLLVSKLIKEIASAPSRRRRG